MDGGVFTTDAPAGPSCTGRRPEDPDLSTDLSGMTRLHVPLVPVPSGEVGNGGLLDDSVGRGGLWTELSLSHVCCSVYLGSTLWKSGW